MTIVIACLQTVFEVSNEEDGLMVRYILCFGTDLYIFAARLEQVRANAKHFEERIILPISRDDVTRMCRYHDLSTLPRSRVSHEPGSDFSSVPKSHTNEKAIVSLDAWCLSCGVQMSAGDGLGALHCMCYCTEMSNRMHDALVRDVYSSHSR